MNKPNNERIGVSKADCFFSSYGWLFREQSISDHGIDAHVEIVNDDKVTGDLIALQIKSGTSYFSEISDVNIIYRTDTRHIEYWLNHSLPVILVLYHTQNDVFYWQHISNKTVSNTGKNWKVNISTDKKLTESSLEELCKISRLHIEKRWLQLSVKSYGDIPQELFDTFFAEFVEKNFGVLERESLIVKLIETYKELASRTDDIGQQANILLSEGKLEEADKLFEQALENDLKNAAANAFSRAKIKVLQFDYPAAKIYYQQAVKLDGDNSLYLNELGFHLCTLGEYATAEPLYIRSLEILEKTLEKDLSYYSSVLNNLAAVYYAQSKYDMVEEFFIRSLEIKEKTLDKQNNSSFATGLNNLAALYKKQGKYTNAENLYQRSLAILEKIHGRNHPYIAVVLSNLAELYRDQTKYTDAEYLLEESLAIGTESLGKNHPSIANILNSLAGVYRIQKKYLKAENLYQHSLEIRKKIFGLYHSDVAASFNNLAAVFYEQEKYEQAKSLFLYALVIAKEVFGENHINVSITLWWLAMLSEKQGNIKSAELLYQDSFNILENILGKDHPDTKIAKRNLERLQVVKNNASCLK